MDKSSAEQRRKIMQSIKLKGSRIETRLAQALYANGCLYRKNDRLVFGFPDIPFKRIKLAIFVDSEFWHGFNWDSTKYNIKSNRE